MYVLKINSIRHLSSNRKICETRVTYNGGELFTSLILFFQWCWYYGDGESGGRGHYTSKCVDVIDEGSSLPHLLFPSLLPLMMIFFFQFFFLDFQLFLFIYQCCRSCSCPVFFFFFLFFDLIFLLLIPLFWFCWFDLPRIFSAVLIWLVFALSYPCYCYYYRLLNKMIPLHYDCPFLGVSVVVILMFRRFGPVCFHHPTYHKNKGEMDTGCFRLFISPKVISDYLVSYMRNEP